MRIGSAGLDGERPEATAAPKIPVLRGLFLLGRSCCRGGRDRFGDVHLGHHPAEKVVGALALHLTDLRLVGRVGQNGVEELLRRGVGRVDLPGEARVESLLLGVVQT